jgi:hypothetical protein
MSMDEQQAIADIAGHLFDSTLVEILADANQRQVFTRGFLAGREYTLEQLEGFFEELEHQS